MCICLAGQQNNIGKSSNPAGTPHSSNLRTHWSKVKTEDTSKRSFQYYYTGSLFKETGLFLRIFPFFCNIWHYAIPSPGNKWSSAGRDVLLNKYVDA